jgi:hypothetical protein
VKRLKVIDFGSEVQGVRLFGDRRNPEPQYFRVAFPGGDVDVTRTTDDEYWVHVRVNTPEKCEFGDEVMGKLVDARLDIAGKHASECNEGDFSHPDLYHLAVRIGRRAS